MHEDKKKLRKIGIIMSIFIASAMGIVASVVISHRPDAQTPPFPVFCAINVIESIIVGLLVEFFVPLDKLGKSLAAKANAYPPSVMFNLLNSIPFSVGNSVIVSMVVSFINISLAHSKIPAEVAPPLLGMWFASWAPLLLPSILVSYVISIVISPVVVGLVMGKNARITPDEKKDEA
ncbi:MAG: hypothetical protein K6A38_05075 [Lachnospiraceae bacterium]|nr:hypothetical protein [Lachnospiraceae bacterium]